MLPLPIWPPGRCFSASGCSDFSRSVAHDLRNPLFAVDWYARDLLQSHAADLAPDAQRNLARIARGTKNLSVMDNARKYTARAQGGR